MLSKEQRFTPNSFWLNPFLGALEQLGICLEEIQGYASREYFIEWRPCFLFTVVQSQ